MRAFSRSEASWALAVKAANADNDDDDDEDEDDDDDEDESCCKVYISLLPPEG